EAVEPVRYTLPFESWVNAATAQFRGSWGITVCWPKHVSENDRTRIEIRISPAESIKVQSNSPKTQDTSATAANYGTAAILLNKFAVLQKSCLPLLSDALG